MGPIVSLLACVLIVGWLAPNLSAGKGDAIPVGAPAGEAARFDANRTAQWSAGQIVLKRQGDGHFYTSVSVDGTQVRFLVDTGASVVALTGDDANSVGLYWDESKVRPVGRGASGTVLGVPVRLDRLEIEGLEVRDVQAVVIPEGLDVSLLGQSVLSKIDNVEISGDQMTLGS